MLFDPNQARYSQMTSRPTDQPATGTPAQDAAAADCDAAASPVAAPRVAGPVGDALTILGPSGLAVAVVGTGLAAAAILWALRLEVPYQVALLAGFTTLAATVCVCAAMVAVRYFRLAAAVVATEPGSPAVADMAVEAATGDMKAEPAAAIATPAAPPDHEDAEIAAAAAADEGSTRNEEPAAEPQAVSSPDIADAAPVRQDDAPLADEPAPADEPALMDDPALADEPALTEEPVLADAPAPTDEPPDEPAPSGHPAEPDYAAWARADKFRVADAARLWCGLMPGDHITDEVTTWASAMLAAVERGDLPKCKTTGVLAQYKNGWHTELRRDDLKAWAASNGQAPRFLGDDTPADP
jgi:hypothetical protein